MLLSSIGAPNYAVLSDLLVEPKQSVITERFHFHKRDQATGKTISDFDATVSSVILFKRRSVTILFVDYGTKPFSVACYPNLC